MSTVVSREGSMDVQYQCHSREQLYKYILNPTAQYVKQMNHFLQLQPYSFDVHYLFLNTHADPTMPTRCGYPMTTCVSAAYRYLEGSQRKDGRGVWNKSRNIVSNKLHGQYIIIMFYLCCRSSIIV
jgi:hypothetical protein